MNANIKDKLSIGYIHFYKKVIFFFLFAILSILILASFVSTAWMDYNEGTYFKLDNLPLNIIFILLIISVIFLIRKSSVYKSFSNKLENNNKYYYSIQATLFILLTIISIIWILKVPTRLDSDELSCQRIAQQFLNGNYDSLGKEGYLSRYPNQLGFILFSMPIHLIFKDNAITILRILNCFCLSGIYLLMAKISNQFHMKRTEQSAIQIMGFIFYPFIMYCSFVYGIIIGLFFSLLAIYLAIYYFNDNKPVYAIGSAVSMGMAVFVKMNNLIFFIGLLIWSLTRIIQTQKIRKIILPILLISALLLQSNIPAMTIRKITGYPFDQGCSSLSYIAMGLQDGRRAPGWYNGFNYDTYTESGYNTEIQSEMAKKAVSESISGFINDPIYAIKFFAMKIDSQWCNPTFQSYWIINFRKSEDIIWDSRVQYLLSDKAIEKAVIYLNLIQSAIYFGALLCAIFYRKENNNVDYLIFPLIFIGGFVFHLFWEGKCQYTLPYFVLLIPWMISGFSYTVQTIENKLSSIESKIR